MIPSDSPDHLTLHETADRLGVHYMTVYRYVRTGMLRADKAGGSWRVDPRDLARFRAPVEPAAAPDGSPVRSGPGDLVASAAAGRPRRAAWSERLRARMLAGDVEGSWDVIESAMASGAEPAEVHLQILGPALGEIGAMWRRGEATISDEHLASGVAALLVGRLSPRFRRRGRHRGTVLVAMPAGERHGLATAILSDLLRGDGFEVRNLGPDTPPASLAAAMADAPDLVAAIVSVVNAARLPAAARLIAAARRQSPNLPIVAGGPAVPDRSAAIELGADGWAADPSALADVIVELSHR